MATSQSNPVIRMDKSKRFSEVRGERRPNDPHYGVHFMQNGLPFDAGGILMRDDGKTKPWEELDPDGKKVEHHPLYSPDMREKVERMKARMQKNAPAQEPEEVNEHSDQEEREAAADEVNIESWLRGEIEYEPWMLYAAVKKRFSRNHTKLRDLVVDMVEDERLVPEELVHSRRMALINGTRAAA